MSLQPSLNNPENPSVFFKNNQTLPGKTVDSLCLYPYASLNNDLSLLRFQAMKLMQATQMKLQQNFHAIKLESAPKCENIDEDTIKCPIVPKYEALSGNIIKQAKLEAPKQEFHAIQQNYDPLPEPKPQAPLKSEVQKMLRFLLANMGKNNQALLQSVRSHYLQNPALLEVYDKIIMKYYSAKKCKEDLIRYILRKAFRSIRTSIMKNEKVNSKKATLLLCKRYFKPDAEQIEAEDEDELLESLMPYHKNSKNKTMNINFVLEIFTSESFYREYLQFLPTFNGILIEENGKKEEKLVEFVVQCIQENTISKVGSLRRLPWIDVWIEDAKNLAIAIMPNKRLVYNCKKAEI